MSKRPTRIQLHLSPDQKEMALACARSLGLTVSEFFVRSAEHERKRLKIKLKRPQRNLFDIENPQLKLEL